MQILPGRVFRAGASHAEGGFRVQGRARPIGRTRVRPSEPAVGAGPTGRSDRAVEGLRDGAARRSDLLELLGQELDEAFRGNPLDHVFGLRRQDLEEPQIVLGVEADAGLESLVVQGSVSGATLAHPC